MGSLASDKKGGYNSEQDKTRKAFYGLHFFWRDIGNFNEGHVMIAFKYQKDYFGSNIGMGLEGVKLGMMTDLLT